ncbi:MAG: hypothetical protein AB7O44_27345 [Hyphomicrobiaceae bacterium]|uniref:hypothetical protein n=1 Tax=Hyphomicrobium sp. TaxID=82 RepID=UPI003D0F2E72
MRIIRQRDMIRGVRARWRKQYPDDGRQLACGESAGDVFARLSGLDLETCSAADVEEIIGNDTWTTAACSECGRSVPDVVTLGEARDSEIEVCLPCIGRAAALAQKSDSL